MRHHSLVSIIELRFLQHRVQDPFRNQGSKFLRQEACDTQASTRTQVKLPYYYYYVYAELGMSIII